MNITPNSNLIPYPGHDYQLKPYVPENPVRRPNFGPQPIVGHSRFRRPHPNIQPINLEIPNHTYDVRQNLAYPLIDQVGHLIDIYA